MMERVLLAVPANFARSRLVRAGRRELNYQIRTKRGCVEAEMVANRCGSSS